MNGIDLLADFRENRSEGAFTELVRRYTNLVYSVAKRRLSNISLAEDATQTVFIRLAKAAPKLRGDAELAGWLHRTTVHVSIDLWRSEFRRRAREEQAAAMQTPVDENIAWNEVAPVLDEALNELTDAERQAILLRFFEHKTMHELGLALGVSEDAAKMRVSRALDRLRTQLGGRGVACSAMVLGPMLAERAVEAAPGSLVAALMCLNFPLPAGVGAAAGFFGGILHVGRAKLMAGLVATLLVGVVTLVLFRSPNRVEQVATVDVPPNPATNLAQSQAAAAPATEATEMATEEREPDPLKLLQAVARARQKISSGSIELQLAVEHFLDERTETNQLQLSALFDGQKLRWEQVGREYRYTAIGDESAAQEARIKADGLDKAAAVREGLLQGFEAHYVTAYDGAVMLTYTETDGKSAGTVIDDPKGSSQSLFDPRCLGLRSDLGVHNTIENSLGLNDPKSVKLVGKELLDGVPAWHVHVQSKYDEALDFWMEVAHPTQVVQARTGANTVISKYAPAQAGQSLPTEVTTTGSYGSSRITRRFLRTEARFNQPIDPASWTLAGLGMALETTVSDNRIHRRIGYWTGAGLSEFLPKKGTEAAAPPNMAELMAILENDPTSLSALEAAAWIILNTPDGPEVQKAGEVILLEHTRNTTLGHLCKELERVRPRCTTNLLEAILKENPSAEVRATACFYLATLRKEAAKFGQNRSATAEAEKLFERVTTEFVRLGPVGADLARRAKPELDELRHLLIGMPAPETEGEDIEGQKVNLSDHRGKVVVLAFWCCGYSEAPEHRKFLERMNGKPISLISVTGENRLAKVRAAVGKYEVTWPCLWDNGMGPIHSQWNVRKWLTTFVLDRNGIIRYRDVTGRDLDAAVEVLLRE